MERYTKYFFSFGIMTAVGIVITAVLFWQHRTVQDQLQRVEELKQEYRFCIAQIKKVLQNQGEGHQDQVMGEGGLFTSFPEGAQIFSSNSEENGQDSFVIVNRDLEYLKQSTHSHMQDGNIELLLKQLDPEVWQEYTSFALTSAQEKKQTKSKTSRKKRRSKRNHTIHTAISKYARKDAPLSWPIERSRFWLSSFFGVRRNDKKGFHYGLDMAALRGTPVKAAGAGVVKEAGYARGYGNTIFIIHQQLR